MNPSSLQQQFPLSAKKYWKKMINKLLGLYLLALVVVGVIVALMIVGVAGSANPNQGGAYLFLGILILAILIVVAVITFLYSWYVKTYIKRYYYAGEDHFITIKKGVFAPAEIHVQWQKIQDVYVDQDILDRIMGLYDVHIASATAASGLEAHIDGVDETAAEGLKKFLLGKVSNSGMQNGNRTMNVSGSGSGQNGEAPSVAPRPTAKVNLSEEISNTRYPLTKKWFVVSLIGRILSAIVAPLFVVFVIWLRLSDTTRTTNGSVFWAFAVWLALALISMVWSVISLFLWKKNYAFNFTADNIYFRQGVIALSEKHMPYSSVQDVSVQQGVLERLFGLAKVRIENAAQGPVIQGRNGRVSVFNGVLIQGLELADANKITDMLKTTVLGRNSAQYGL
jgi:putative membrane protein